MSLPNFASNDGINVLCEIRDYLAQLAGFQRPSFTNRSLAGTAADAYGSDIVLPMKARSVNVSLFNNGAVIQRANDVQSQYDDEIELIAPGIYQLEAWTVKLRIRNSVAGSNARYEIVAWD